MSHVVVEVGPIAVRGPNPIDAELVSAALEAIDDDLVLVGEHAASVSECWAELLRVAIGETDTAVLVCPTWWPNARVERVREATAAPAVEVIGRTTLLQRQARATVVEMSRELIVVTRPGARAVVIANVGAEVVAKVMAAVGLSGPVLIDGPDETSGPIAEEIIKRSRDNRIEARFVDEDAVRHLPPTPVDRIATRDANRPRRTLKLVGLLVTVVAVCGALGLRGGGVRIPTDESTLLVEGRVRMTVPAAWPVEHITTGPGSARAQIASPSDDDVMIHLTQSVGPADADLTQTAASLRAALSEEPGDIFVEFNPADAPAGRTAVTYRELRPDRHVAWTVLVDDGVRIAIGCQSAPGREDRVRDVCDRAIRSAHAITRESGGTGPPPGAS